MNIAIFKEITTEEYLLEIEADGKKYEGLYVDMTNAPERKFVKEQAANIKAMLKRLDSERIAKARDYRSMVEREAETIKQRLEAANSPYTLLIDAYAADCKKVRDEAKAIEDAKALAVQIENDHEHALLLDNQVMYEKHLAEENRIKYEAKLKEEAAAKAIENQRLLIEAEEQKRVNEEKARLANTEYLRSVNRAILNELVMIGLNEDDAKAVIKAIAGGTVPNVSIQY